MSDRNAKPNAANKSGSSRPRRARRGRKRMEMVPLPGPSKTEVKTPVPRNTRTRFTAAGRAYLREALNPCGEFEPNSTGIPDGTASETAIVRSRMDNIIAIPSGLASIYPANIRPDWFLMIVIPPWIDDCCFLVASGFQPTTFSSLPFTTASTYPLWTATEADPDLATTLWISRMPEAAFTMTTAVDSVNIQSASSFRMVARGVTCELICDDLTNRGHITAGQYHVEPEVDIANEVRVVYVASASGGSPIEQIPAVVSSTRIMQYLVGSPTPSYLTAANSQTYQGQAKDGVYMPIYKAEGVHKYYPYLPRYLRLVTTSVTSADAHLNSDRPANLYPSKIITPDQNFGIIWFKGIDVGATINFKGRHTIQAVIPPESGWAAFSHTSPVEDENALVAYNRFRNRLHHAYPAAYNDWGLLGGIVKGLLSKVPVFGGTLSNLVEPLGKLLGGVLNIK